MKDIDVVYVLGTGSHWNNNELRFSLRSLQKNLKGFRKIWIVGEKPDWIKGIKHIQHPDEFGPNNADGNIIRKVLRVCQDKDLTNDFLFINDDHIILKPINASDIVPYHKGDMTTFPKEYWELNFWRGRLFRTKNILVNKGYPALHFDCHVPMIMNKKKFPEVVAQFDYQNSTGYTMKSLYGNVVHGNSAPHLNGEKVTIFRPMTLEQVKERVANRQFIAFNDDGLRPGLKHWLMENFPDASSYEKEALRNEPFAEILNWLNGERDFQEGVRLFDKYGKSKKIKKYLTKAETTARYFKLEHQLKELLNYY